MNRPDWAEDWISRLGWSEKYQYKYLGWVTHKVAHYCGLDNRWEMFGRQSRFNWEFDIQAQYSATETPVSLPLPRQSKRSFFEKMIIDFKEAKFHLNLYANEDERAGYARYLARNYPDAKGRYPVRIIYNLKWQNILPRKIASEQMIHLENDVYNYFCDEVKTAHLFIK